MILQMLWRSKVILMQTKVTDFAASGNSPNMAEIKPTAAGITLNGTM